MSFLDKIQKSWNDGAKAIIPGNNVTLEKGINFVMNQAKKYEEEVKEKANNTKATEERI